MRIKPRSCSLKLAFTPFSTSFQPLILMPLLTWIRSDEKVGRAKNHSGPKKDEEKRRKRVPDFPFLSFSLRLSVSLDWSVGL